MTLSDSDLRAWCVLDDKVKAATHQLAIIEAQRERDGTIDVREAVEELLELRKFKRNRDKITIRSRLYRDENDGCDPLSHGKD